MGDKAVIYTRVSHSSQEENTSLESQLKYCQNYAANKGLNVVDHFGGTYESAKTDDRKEFKRMLKFLKQSKGVSHIIVYSYERFSRSGIEGAKIADDLLRNHGIVTLAVTQELDPTTSSGSFQQQIYFLFSKMDNDLRRDKTITGMTELLRKGYVPYSIPIGYTNLNKGGRAVDQKLIINEDGKLIQKAFVWKAKKNLGNTEIVEKLKKLGLSLDKRRLGEIFTNPFYCGVIVSKFLPGEAIEGRHEAMISRELFLEMNETRESLRVHPKKHKTNDEALPLKRFMRCNECDTPMTGYLVKAKGLYYYKCRTSGCKHTASAKKLHVHFEQILDLFQLDACDIPLVEETIKIYYSEFFKERESEKKTLQTKRSSIQKQIDTIEERHVLGKIKDDLFDKYHTKYTTELEEIEREISKDSIDSSNLEKCLKKVLEFCLKPREWWQSQGIEQKIKIQNVIFPEGISLSKQNKGVLTTRINSLFAPVADIAKELAE